MLGIAFFFLYLAVATIEEAMKMENCLISAVSGTVKEILCKRVTR